MKGGGGLGLGSLLAGGVGAGVGLAGALGVASAASGLAGLVVDSVKLAASVEDTATDFRVMLGDAAKAKELFADIRELAAKTPLETKDLADAAKSLLGVGIAADQIVPTLKALGDLAGGQGEKLQRVAQIYGKVREEGRVSGETLQQLTENQIPLTDAFAKVLGKSAAEVRGLAEEGKIGFSDLQRAILSATGEGGRFFGLMDERSKTFNGLLSTLRDNWDQLKASFGQMVIDEFGLKGLLQGLADSTDTAKDNLEGIRPLMHEIAEACKEAARDLYEGGWAFARAIAQAKDAIGEINASYRGLRDFGVSVLTFGGRLGGGVGGGSDMGPAEATVDRLKQQFDKIWGAGAGLFSSSAETSLIPIVGGLGVDFGKAAGASLKVEADRLTREQIKQVRDYKESFDPLLKVVRELGDLKKIADRGGFMDWSKVDAAKGLRGPAFVRERELGAGAFALAAAKMIRDAVPQLDFKGVGAAGKDSSEAVGAIVDALNIGKFTAEDKVVAAINAQKVIQQQQLEAARRLLAIWEKIKPQKVF
jgi:tape measure domain-containing protein